MGSFSNPNPWAPYDSFKDCTLGICSIYCPQYCYIVFPPPPPSASDDDSSGTYFSPLVIAVIGILASAFLLVTYYLLVTRYCRRRQGHRDDRILGSDQSGNTVRDQINQNESAPTTTTGLDEALIKTITVYKYRKGEGLVDGTDCSVCLSEFEENESLRLMPKCSHAFHLPCIDTWLKSHPSCPLCRSNVATIGAAAAPQPAPPAPRMPTSVTVTTAHAYRHRTDTVLVICDESRSDEATVIDINVNDGGVSSPKRMRRSASMNSVLWQSGGSSSSDRPVQSDQENLQFPMAIGDDDRSSNVPEMKRSISTGRFVSGRYGKGRNSIYPR